MICMFRKTKDPIRVQLDAEGTVLLLQKLLESDYYGGDLDEDQFEVVPNAWTETLSYVPKRRAAVNGDDYHVSFAPDVSAHVTPFSVFLHDDEQGVMFNLTDLRDPRALDLVASLHSKVKDSFFEVQARLNATLSKNVHDENGKSRLNNVLERIAQGKPASAQG